MKKILFLLLFLLLSCSQKNIEPIYLNKDVLSVDSFGPGMHSETIIYNNVSGWKNNYKPNWKSCSKSKIDYFYEYGDSWINTFYKERAKVVNIRYWDDDWMLISEKEIFLDTLVCGLIDQA